MSEGSESTVAPLKDASTVVLVRDGEQGIEVFLQHRVKQMAFAGGMTVFPGGGVDPRDGGADITWRGPGIDWWATQFDTDNEVAQKLVCAAVRETYEECGVLLVGTVDGSTLDVGALAPQRALLEDRTLSLAEFLANNGLALRADYLVPLAHWITPKNEKRRYDTHFFLAALPAGQVADDRTTEVEEAYWRSAAGALDDWAAGTCFLLPPTWTQLKEIARYETVADLLAVQRIIEPIEPAVPSDGNFAGLAFENSTEYFATMSAQNKDGLKF
ncbi:NUDIX hydrolase [Gordonia sp. CPCC 205333]|uniref:NUDIX hydrolase n=1 Tax=Gordonia sp. CPCC 205333 TaxID=3140790 RepID=UPI003AF34CC4